MRFFSSRIFPHMFGARARRAMWFAAVGISLVFGLFASSRASALGGAEGFTAKDPARFLDAYEDISLGTQSILKLRKKFQGKLEPLIARYGADDRRIILSIVLGYADVIRDVAYTKGSAAFLINGTWIFYDAGRMALEEHMGNADYRRLFYRYSLRPLAEIYGPGGGSPQRRIDYLRHHDFYLALLGVYGSAVDSGVQMTSRQILSRAGSMIGAITREYNFLDGKTRVHPIAGRALQVVDSRLADIRKKDKAINAFLTGIRRTSGYANRTIRDSSNISMHALGLAVDIIPYNYGGKEAYWIWTREKFPNTWMNYTGLEKRWMVPDAVVRAFEDSGFIWGGKWRNFDMIHFEYRPELVAYARMREAAGEL